MKTVIKYALGLAVLAALPVNSFAQQMLPMPDKVVLTSPQSSFNTPDEVARQGGWQKAILSNTVYKGQEANLSERKPGIVLDGSLLTNEGMKVFTSNIGTEIPMRRGDVKIMNVEHLGKFYLALVDIQDAVETGLSYSEFMPIASHFFTLITFSKPDSVRLIGELIPTADGSGFPGIKMLSTPIHLRHLVANSIEGTSPVGDSGFTLIKGVQDKMTNTYKITTVPSRLQEWFEADHPQLVIPTNFDDTESMSVLMQALWESDRAGISFLYNLWYSNCTNRGMDTIDRAIGERWMRPLLERLLYNTVRKISDITQLSRNYPVLNNWYGAWMRGYKSKTKPRYRLDELPDMEPYLADFVKKYPNSKAVAYLEKRDCDRALLEGKLNSSIR